jgi:hypothetical protein
MLKHRMMIKESYGHGPWSYLAPTPSARRGIIVYLLHREEKDHEKGKKCLQSISEGQGRGGRIQYERSFLSIFPVYIKELATKGGSFPFPGIFGSVSVTSSLYPLKKENVVFSIFWIEHT